ncbi:Protein transport protein Sec24B [Balamuthia mandrillaris]
MSKRRVYPGHEGITGGAPMGAATTTIPYGQPPPQQPTNFYPGAGYPPSSQPPFQQHTPTAAPPPSASTTPFPYGSSTSSPQLTSAAPSSFPGSSSSGRFPPPLQQHQHQHQQGPPLASPSTPPSSSSGGPPLPGATGGPVSGVSGFNPGSFHGAAPPPSGGGPPSSNGPSSASFSSPPPSTSSSSSSSSSSSTSTSTWTTSSPYLTPAFNPSSSTAPSTTLPQHNQGPRYYPDPEGGGGEGGYGGVMDATTAQLQNLSLQQQTQQAPSSYGAYPPPSGQQQGGAYPYGGGAPPVMDPFRSSQQQYTQQQQYQPQQFPPFQQQQQPYQQQQYQQQQFQQQMRPLGQEDELKPRAESQCPATFMRMTINAIPNSPAMLTKACIPLGAVVQPLSHGEEVPVVNFGSIGILRCRNCRAYINPFVQFIDAGRRWRCNLCGLPNEVPTGYFCEMDKTGLRRLDQNERPELSKGCVEFVAPSEYMVRRPMPPTYFFVIDVSYYSISSGMLKTCVESIQSTLDSLPDNDRTYVGFVTFDSTIHFYNLKSSLTQPRMLVVSDIEDVFLPLPDDMLVNLKESREVVDSLLARLPSMHANTNNVESALGPALKAVWNIMRPIGGKMMLFLSKLPSLGFARLKQREDTKLLGTDKEVNLLKPEENFYKDFALDCSRQQISVDTFLFSPQYTDVATLSTLSRYTGGQTFYYPAYAVQKDGQKFSLDLKNALTRETGWEAVMRIRASKGLKVQSHYGNFFIRSSDLLALPAVDCDKAFAVQFQLAEAFTTTKYVSIQNALLYTTSFGERRIRVATVCLPVTSSLSDLFKFADVDAIVTLTTKMAIEKALTSKLSDTRQALLNKCIDILSVYRSSFASPNTSSTQLVLPESLKLLPLYTLALIKNLAFRAGSDIRPDERAYHLGLLRTLSVQMTIPFIYPHLYALKDLSPECGVKGDDGKVVLPPVLNLSTEKLDQSGLFLLDDGQYLLLWIGKAVHGELLEQLFGVSSLAAIEELELHRRENEYSVKVCAIVEAIRRERPGLQKLYVIREGDATEIRFFSHFVDDRTKTLPSYYEFLCQLQRQVQTKTQ